VTVVDYSLALSTTTQRTLAAVGQPADHSAKAEFVQLNPLDDARKLFAGTLEPDQIDKLIDGLKAGAANAMLIVQSCPTAEVMIGSLYMLLAQHVLIGALLSQDG
jgi:hypothetical protein